MGEDLATAFFIKMPELIMKIIEFIKSLLSSQITKLKEKINELEDSAKKTGEDHSKEIEEYKKKLEKLENFQKQVEKIDPKNPKYQKTLIDTMRTVANDENAKKNGWIDDNKNLTKEGMEEVTKRCGLEIVEAKLDSNKFEKKIKKSKNNSKNQNEKNENGITYGGKSNKSNNGQSK